VEPTGERGGLPVASSGDGKRRCLSNFEVKRRGRIVRPAFDRRLTETVQSTIIPVSSSSSSVLVAERISLW
jgi:hypothetical protein